MRSALARHTAKTSPRLLVSGVLIAWLLFAFYRWCFLPYACNIFKRKTEATMLAAENAIGTGRAITARNNVDMTLRWIKRCPNDLDLYMIAGGSLRQIGRSDQAIGMYAMALRLDRRPELYLNLGQSQAEAGQLAEAVPALVEAVRFDPALITEVPASLQQRVSKSLQSAPSPNLTSSWAN